METVSLPICIISTVLGATQLVVTMVIVLYPMTTSSSALTLGVNGETKIYTLKKYHTNMVANRANFLIVREKKKLDTNDFYDRYLPLTST